MDVKSRGLEEPQYAPIFVAPAASFANSRRLHYLFRLAEKVRDVEGEWVECGVEYGQSLFMLATILYDSHPTRNLWAFDSFRGPYLLSPEDANSQGAMWKPNLDMVQDEENNLIRFMAGLNFYGLPSAWVTSHLFVVQGYFHETLHLLTADKISFLSLDANYYDGVKTVLDTLYPKMSKGCIVALDEYSSSWDLDHFRGARVAVDEFCERTGNVVTQDREYGKYHILIGG